MANFISMAQPWPQDDVHWEAPEPPWYKINVDEAVFVGYTQLVWGQLYEIINEGRVTATLSWLLPIPLGPLDRS